jgi:hypothetical protein
MGFESLIGMGVDLLGGDDDGGGLAGGLLGGGGDGGGGLGGLTGLLGGGGGDGGGGLGGLVGNALGGSSGGFGGVLGSFVQGDGLGDAIDDFAGSSGIGDLIGGVMGGSADDIVSGVGDLAGDAASDFLGSGGGLASGVTNLFGGSGDSGGGGGWLGGLTNSLGSAVGEVADTGGFSSIVDQATDAVGGLDLDDASSAVSSALGGGWFDKLGGVVDDAEDSFGAAAGILSSASELTGGGSGIFSSVTDALASAGPLGVTEISDGVSDALSEGLSGTGGIGSSFGSSLGELGDWGEMATEGLSSLGIDLPTSALGLTAASNWSNIGDPIASPYDATEAWAGATDDVVAAFDSQVEVAPETMAGSEGGNEPEPDFDTTDDILGTDATFESADTVGDTRDVPEVETEGLEDLTGGDETSSLDEDPVFDDVAGGTETEEVLDLVSEPEGLEDDFTQAIEAADDIEESVDDLFDDLGD